LYTSGVETLFFQRRLKSFFELFYGEGVKLQMSRQKGDIMAGLMGEPANFELFEHHRHAHDQPAIIEGVFTADVRQFVGARGEFECRSQFTIYKDAFLDALALPIVWNPAAQTRAKGFRPTIFDGSVALSQRKSQARLVCDGGGVDGTAQESVLTASVSS